MLALRNLLRRKVRTALTVLGVALGVGAVVALLSVTTGLRTQFDGFFGEGEAHLVVSKRAAADPFISYLPDDLIAELAASPLVARVHPLVMSVVQIPGLSIFFAYGVTEGSPFLDNVRVVAGRGLFEEGNPERSVVVGRSAADHLELAVGSRLELAAEEYEVVGIFESAIAFVEGGGLLPFPQAQVETGLEDRMTSAMLTLADSARGRLADVEARIEEAFPSVEATPPGSFSNAFDEFELVDQAVRVLTLLSVLVGGIGVMNTMLMSVFERTRELGVLQAIGWSKAMVLRQVLAEAFLVSLAGGLVGVGLGVLTVEAIGALGQYGWLGGDYGLPVFAQAVAVGIGMGLFGAAYPTLRALRITPIEALRYE